MESGDVFVARQEMTIEPCGGWDRQVGIAVSNGLKSAVPASRIAHYLWFSQRYQDKIGLIAVNAKVAGRAKNVRLGGGAGRGRLAFGGGVIIIAVLERTKDDIPNNEPLAEIDS